MSGLPACLPSPTLNQMIKKQELTDPTSCMSHAEDEEMTFVLLGRDPIAERTIRYWISQRIQSGKNNHTDPQIVEAVQCAEKMVEFRLAWMARHPAPPRCKEYDTLPYLSEHWFAGPASDPGQCVNCGLEYSAYQEMVLAATGSISNKL